MKLSVKHFVTLGITAGVLLFSSCETKNSKKTVPAPQALAPSVQPKPDAAPTPQPVVVPQVKQEPPKPDPVVATVASAEQAYQEGQADYKAGHLDAAKKDFNHAVDILMQSPVEIKSDERLQQEFDKITEGIHALEMVAFKEGDGFTAQQSEPAPIDEANHLTFAPDPKVTAKAEAELKTTQSDLPLVINDYVAGYINYYSTRGRGTFERAVPT